MKNKTITQSPTRSYSWPRRRVRVTHKFTTPSLTRQSEVNDSDLNVIYRKYTQTGFKPEKPVYYSEVDHLHSLQDALQIQANAQTAFEQLPAHIRDRFNNDPVQAAKFLQDAKNHDEGVRLGLIPPRQPVPVPAPGAPASPPEPVKSGSKSQKGKQTPSNDDSNDDKGV